MVPKRALIKPAALTMTGMTAAVQAYGEQLPQRFWLELVELLSQLLGSQYYGIQLDI